MCSGAACRERRVAVGCGLNPVNLIGNGLENQGVQISNQIAKTAIEIADTTEQLTVFFSHGFVELGHRLDEFGEQLYQGLERMLCFIPGQLHVTPGRLGAGGRGNPLLVRVHTNRASLALLEQELIDGGEKLPDEISHAESEIRGLSHQVIKPGKTIRRQELLGGRRAASPEHRFLARQARAAYARYLPV